MSLLDQEMLSNILFYYQNQQALKVTYCGKYLLIKDEKVLRSFCTWQEACSNGLKMFQQDNFFVKYCR